MEPARTLAISTLRALIALDQTEEKRLRKLLTNPGSPHIGQQAERDLERLLMRVKTLTAELTKLEAGIT